MGGSQVGTALGACTSRLLWSHSAHPHSERCAGFLFLPLPGVVDAMKPARLLGQPDLHPLLWVGITYLLTETADVPSDLCAVHIAGLSANFGCLSRLFDLNVISTTGGAGV